MRILCPRWEETEDQVFSRPEAYSLDVCQQLQRKMRCE